MKTLIAIAITVAIAMISVPAKAQEPKNKPEGSAIAPATDSKPGTLIITPTSEHKKTDKQQKNTDTRQVNDKIELRDSIVSPCYGNHQPSWCN